MLSLPDELILAISDLLSYTEKLKLACVCKRLYVIISATTAFTLIDGGGKPIHDFTRLQHSVQQTGESLVHAKSVIIRTEIKAKNPKGSPDSLNDALSVAVELDHLILVNRTHTRTHPVLELSKSPVLPSYFSTVRSIAFSGYVPQWSYISAFRNLQELIIDDSCQHSLRQAARLAGYLYQLKTLYALTLTTWQMSLPFLSTITKQITTLRRLALVWAPNKRIPTHSSSLDVAVHVKLYASALSHCPKLTSVFLPVCVTSDQRSTESLISSGHLRISSLDSIVHITSTDTLAACKKFSSACPKLSFIGWVIPGKVHTTRYRRNLLTRKTKEYMTTEDGLVPLGCWRKDDEWTCSMDMEEWAESDSRLQRFLQLAIRSY